MPSSPLPRRTVRTVIGLCFAIAMLEGFDIQALGVALPHMAQALHLDPRQQGLAGSATMVGLVVGALLAGPLSDRFGRKPILIGSVLLFGVASLWTAAVDDHGALLGARLLAGLGFGGAMPLLIAIAAETSTQGMGTVTASAIFCGMPVGGSAVALAASRRPPSLSWRGLFVAGGVIPILIALLVFMFFPETRRPSAAAPPQPLMRVLFGGRQLPATILLWTTSFLTLLTLYLMLNWLPSLVVASGHTVSAGASAALFFNLAGALGALAIGLAIDRFGYRWPLSGAYLTLAVCTLLLGDRNDVATTLLLAAAAGFITMGAQYALYGLTPSLYPAEARAAGAGASVAMGRFGSIAGPMLAGNWRQAGYAPGMVLKMLAPIALAAALAVFLLSFVPAGKRP